MFYISVNGSLLIRLAAKYLVTNLLYINQFESFVYINMLVTVFLIFFAAAGSYYFSLMAFRMAGLEQNKRIGRGYLILTSALIPYLIYCVYIYIFSKSSITLGRFAVFSIRTFTALKIAASVLLFIRASKVLKKHRKILLREFALFFLTFTSYEFFMISVLGYGYRGLHLSLYYLVINLFPLIFLRYFFDHYYGKTEMDARKRSLVDELFDKHNISKREREIISYICEGMSNKEIAWDLSISEQTVKHHVYNIYQKMGINSRVEMINMIHSA